MVDNKELANVLTQALEALKKQEPVNAEVMQLDREIVASEQIHARLVSILDSYLSDEDNERVVKAMLVGWLDVARKASVGMLRNKRHGLMAYEDFDEEDYLPTPAHMPTMDIVLSEVTKEEVLIDDSANEIDWRTFLPTMLGAGVGSAIVSLLVWGATH